MRIIKVILLCSAFIIASYSLRAQDGTNDIPKGAEDAGFITAYSSYRINIPTYFYNDSLYLPLIQTLSFLKIYFVAGGGINSITGYFLSKDSTFDIDFSINKARFKKRVIEFTDKDYFKTDLEVFVLPSLMKKIFGFNPRILRSELTVYIESKVDLPLLLEDKRKSKYSYLDSKELKDKVMPLIYGRKWSLINGGIVNYNLGAANYAGNMNYQYGASFGLQLLGGDMQYNTQGAYASDKKGNTFTDNWRWRYDLDNNWLSNVTAGNISPSSFRSSSFNNIRLDNKQYQGVQISNEKVQHNYNFTTMAIEDIIAPDWQVELYVNGLLSAQKTTDALGYYRFDLPINYGNNNITLKFYGPNGEFVDKVKVISVPSDFLPPGKVKYTVGGGITEGDKQYIGTGSVSVGITNWLTSTVNVQKTDNVQDLDILNHTAVRLGGNLTLSTDYAPNKLMSGGLSMWSEKMGTYNLAYTKFNGYSNLNNRGGDNAIDLNASLPRIAKLPVNITLRSSRVQSQSSVNYMVNSDLSMYLSQFNIRVGYSAYLNQVTGQADNLRQDINPTVNFSWYKKPKFLSFLNSTRFTLGTNYNTDIKKLTYADLSVQQALFKNWNLQLTYRTDLIYGNSSFNMSLQMNLSKLRSSTSSNVSSQSPFGFSQSLSGMVGFEPQNMKFNFDNSQSYGSVGTGAAKFRFFIDNNSNNKFDEGEYEIPGVSVSTSMGQGKTDPKGSTIVYSLPVGERINVTVNLESFKNPLWMPKYKEFAMIADPNSFKKIDVPCFASGMVEVKVMKNDAAKTGQAGVKVHFRNTKSNDDIPINVFSDGSFYEIGIPPGDYTVYVDSMQLRLLNTVSTPANMAITIVSKMEGDYAGNINFVLSDNDSVATWKKENAELIAKQSVERNKNSLTSPISENKPEVATIADTTTAEAKYKIQLLASRKPIKVNDQFAKLLENKPELTIEEHKGNDGWYRYSAGAFTNVDEANESMKTIKESGWKRCFVAKEKK